MNKHLSSNIVNLVFVLIGIALFFSAQSTKTGAVIGLGGDFLPKLMTGIWVTISISIFIAGLREPKKESTESNTRDFIATLALLTVYFLLIYLIGFVMASILYIFIQILLFATNNAKNKKNYVVYAIIAIAFSVMVNMIFVNIFSLIMPAGLLF